MKKILLAAFISASLFGYAQDYSVPAASPRQKVEQQFSISKVSIDYGRPAVKGRKIFGELVPYGKVWRAGANSNTKITFGQPVLFGGKEVSGNSFGLHIIPQEKEWKIVLNKDSNAWGSYSYDEKLNVVEVSVPTEKLASKKEYFEMTLDVVDENTLTLVISWDFTKVQVPIKVQKPEVVAKMAEKLKEAKQIERDSNKK